VALSPVLQTILARQSLMLSAMFNLTGMVEDLLLNNGKTRKRPVARVEEGLVHSVPLQAEERGRIPGVLVAEPVAVRDAETPAIPPPASRLPSRFGSLGRRRRRGTLAVLSALLLGLLLVFFLPTLNEDETATSNRPTPNAAAEQQKTPEERPAGAGADEEGEEGGGNPTDGVVTDAAPPVPETTSAAESAGTTPSPPDPNSGVPDVSGRPLEEAARTVFEAGYTVAAIRTVKSQEEPGTVTETEPSAGTEARPKAPVVLTMSAGPTGVSSATAASAGASSASVSSASASSVAASASSSASASPSP